MVEFGEPEIDFWYAISWGGGNVTVEDGQIMYHRVYVGDVTYTTIPEEVNESSKRYVGIDTVEPYALRELVQAIYVEKPDKSSGTRQQKIRIKYNGVGFIPLEELMKKAAA